MPTNTPAHLDKRLHVTVLGVLLVALNKKLGLELDSADLIAVGGLISAFIVQSQMGAVSKAKAAGEAAAAEVKTSADAAAVLGQ